MMTAGPSPPSQPPFLMPNITPGLSAASQLPIVTPKSTAAPSAMISKKLYPSHLGPSWSREARAAQEAQSAAHLQKVNRHMMKVAAHHQITLVLYYKACSLYQDCTINTDWLSRQTFHQSDTQLMWSPSLILSLLLPVPSLLHSISCQMTISLHGMPSLVIGRHILCKQSPKLLKTNI